MASAKPPGVITPDAVYTLSEFQERTGLGRWAVKQARKAGLRTLRMHRRAFVRGRDFVDYLNAHGKQPTATRRTRRRSA